MTKEEAIEILKDLLRYEKAVKCDDMRTRGALYVAIDAMKQPEIIRCIDCVHCTESNDVDMMWCRNSKNYVFQDFYCKDARRREE